jgi:hypothetical protein
MDEVGVSAVRFPQGPAHAVFPVRCQNQMDMIRHEAVSPHLHTELACLLGKQITINLLISIFEEDCLATISALGHVVRKTRDDHAGEATHAAKYHELRRIGTGSPNYHRPFACTGEVFADRSLSCHPDCNPVLQLVINRSASSKSTAPRNRVRMTHSNV